MPVTNIPVSSITHGVLLLKFLRYFFALPSYVGGLLVHRCRCIVEEVTFGDNLLISIQWNLTHPLSCIYLYLVVVGEKMCRYMSVTTWTLCFISVFWSRSYGCLYYRAIEVTFATVIFLIDVVTQSETALVSSTAIFLFTVFFFQFCSRIKKYSCCIPFEMKEKQTCCGRKRVCDV